MKFKFRFKGGTGSGHHRHRGRPGKHGGSVAGSGANSQASSTQKKSKRDKLMDESDQIKEEYRRLRSQVDKATGRKLASLQARIRELNERQVQIAEELKKL